MAATRSLSRPPIQSAMETNDCNAGTATTMEEQSGGSMFEPDGGSVRRPFFARASGGIVPNEGAQRGAHPSRREALKKGLVVGGLIWTVPVVNVVSITSAHAAQPSSPGSGSTGGRGEPATGGRDSTDRASGGAVAQASSSTDEPANAVESAVGAVLAQTGGIANHAAAVAVGTGLIATGAAAVAGARRQQGSTTHTGDS
jgi:hypothetical protein